MNTFQTKTRFLSAGPWEFLTEGSVLRSRQCCWVIAPGAISLRSPSVPLGHVVVENSHACQGDVLQFFPLKLFSSVSWVQQYNKGIKSYKLPSTCLIFDTFQIQLLAPKSLDLQPAITIEIFHTVQNHQRILYARLPSMQVKVKGNYYFATF